MISTQMLKGMLEGCVLKVISEKETYGYEISETLKSYGFGVISEGTVYPLLLRLQKNGLISAEYKESPVGPRRKYFSITDKGLKEIECFHDNFTELESAVDRLFRERGNGHEEESQETEEGKQPSGRADQG